MIRAAVAEDDFRVAAVHEKFLKKIEGIEVVGIALNAKEVLELLEREEVDLLLMDIYMPDQLGTDLLPTLRARYPGVDIIMITAATDKGLLEKSVRNGVINYLIKPVTLERFIETISEYKQKKQLISNREEVDQTLIDQYLGRVGKSDRGALAHLPKGIDELTLAKVKKITGEHPHGFSAETAGEKMGASRTTARRYLEYLISVGEARAELVYGEVGRPERIYFPVK